MPGLWQTSRKTIKTEHYQKRVCLDGMKEHMKIKASLPCSWADHILVHKQASLKEMNPEQPFYLLDNGA
jgi:hypothetical protein